jgi:hypothetical protein
LSSELNLGDSGNGVAIRKLTGKVPVHLQIDGGSAEARGANFSDALDLLLTPDLIGV